MASVREASTDDYKNVIEKTLLSVNEIVYNDLTLQKVIN